MANYIDETIIGILGQDYQFQNDDYLDPTSYERLSKLFSRLGGSNQGHDIELSNKTSNLENAAKKLEEDLINKASPNVRTKTFKSAAKLLAKGLINDALTGLSTSWATKSGGALRTDRALELSRILQRKQAKPEVLSEFMSISLDLSEAYSFLAKAQKLGDLNAIKGYREDLRKIIFKQSALTAAKGAVSDILTDIYLSKSKRDKDSKISSKLLAGIKKLIGSIQQLSYLKRIINVKSKEASMEMSRVTYGSEIELLQSLISFLDEMLIDVNHLIDEIDSFVTNPTKGVLSSALGNVNGLIHKVKITKEQITSISKLKILRNTSLIQTFSQVGNISFSEREDNELIDKVSRKSIFDEVDEILNDVKRKINEASNTSLSSDIENRNALLELLSTTTRVKNPSYNSDMGSLSAANEPKQLEIYGSRLMTERQTQDADVLEVLYSVTDNLSLVFDDKDMDEGNIDRIKEAIGDAVFGRSGLESEVGNYITGLVEGQFERALL